VLNPAAPFRTALRDRNIRRLLAGLTASQAGDWLYNLALLAFVYERTHSSLWVGLTTGARVLPAVVLGPLAGVLADRVDRRVLMLGSDAIGAATMAGLAILAVAHGPIVLVPLLAALCTAGASVYIPCVVAVTPRLASDEQLPAVNAARVSIQSICVVGGPLFGAVLMLLGSVAIAFIVNGATFLLGALAVSGLPREALRRPVGAQAESRQGLRREIATGWRALRGYTEAMEIVGANVIASLVYGALTVLLVILGDRLGLGAAGYGYLLAAAGAGGVLAAGVSNRAANARNPRRALIVSMIAVGAPLPVLAVVNWLPAALLLAALFGAGNLVAEVVGDTCLQRELDPNVFARAYGLVLPACFGGIVAGALLAPLGIALLGFGGTLVFIGAGVIAYGVLVLARPAAVPAPLAAVAPAE
jgi:predicted MFS family arabinose efflux permease